MIKRSLVGFALFLIFTFLGTLLLVLKGLGFDELPFFARLPPYLTGYWIIFTPFWLANLAGLALVIELIIRASSLRPTTRDEKRNMARYKTFFSF